MNNGGVLENEPVIDGVPQQRFWIDLTNGAGGNVGIVRHMSLEEVPQCVEVIRSSFKTVADEFGFTQKNAPRFTAFATDEERIRYQFCEEKRPMYVYLLGAQIVGFYSLALLNDEEVELNNLAVLPDYRHRKIGEKLLADSEEKAFLYGRKKLKVGIVEENTVLRTWYENHGFDHRETKKYDFFPFTCGYMEKLL